MNCCPRLTVINTAVSPLVKWPSTSKLITRTALFVRLFFRAFNFLRPIAGLYLTIILTQYPWWVTKKGSRTGRMFLCLPNGILMRLMLQGEAAGRC